MRIREFKGISIYEPEKEISINKKEQDYPQLEEVSVLVNLDNFDGAYYQTINPFDKSVTNTMIKGYLLGNHSRLFTLCTKDRRFTGLIIPDNVCLKDFIFDKNLLGFL